ncbi:hypothetical protein V1282_007031 [Nitrobacteraceae bacterium AZCC 2146]
MLQETNSAQECWTERDGAPRTALTRSVFPDDALAVIYKPARSAMTSGKARTRDWKLRFEPRSAPYIEPLMGWTGCDDTLSQVELTFPSAAAAVAYARRQGLRYLLQGADDPDTRPGSNAKVANTNSSSPDIRSSDVWPWQLEWVERTLGLRAFKTGRDRYAVLPRITRVPRTCLMTTIFRRRRSGRFSVGGRWMRT